MVKRSYQETIALIQPHRELMDKLVEVLIEKETITGEELTKVLANYTDIPKKYRTESIFST